MMGDFRTPTAADLSADQWWRWPAGKEGGVAKWQQWPRAPVGGQKLRRKAGAGYAFFDPRGGGGFLTILFFRCPLAR
jgi:hypothetical protein